MESPRPESVRRSLPVDAGLDAFVKLKQAIKDESEEESSEYETTSEMTEEEKSEEDLGTHEEEKSEEYLGELEEEVEEDAFVDHVKQIEEEKEIMEESEKEEVEQVEDEEEKEEEWEEEKEEVEEKEKEEPKELVTPSELTAEGKPIHPDDYDYSHIKENAPMIKKYFGWEDGDPMLVRPDDPNIEKIGRDLWKGRSIGGTPLGDFDFKGMPKEDRKALFHEMLDAPNKLKKYQELMVAYDRERLDRYGAPDCLAGLEFDVMTEEELLNKLGLPQIDPETGKIPSILPNADGTRSKWLSDEMAATLPENCLAPKVLPKKNEEVIDLSSSGDGMWFMKSNNARLMLTGTLCTFFNLRQMTTQWNLLR